MQQELQEPLHFNVCAETEELLAKAAQKVRDLVENTKADMAKNVPTGGSFPMQLPQQQGMPGGVQVHSLIPSHMPSNMPSNMSTMSTMSSMPAQMPSQGPPQMGMAMGMMNADKAGLPTQPMPPMPPFPPMPGQ
jgi:hypothetical protein